MPGKKDPRIAIAIGAAALLAAVVGIVAVAGGGGGEASAAAPQRCVSAWNASPDALAYGRHNYGSHGYDRVRVEFLSESAVEPAEGEKGVCAVVFGALSLDTERIAAGQLLIDGAWVPIALQPGVELTRLAELQTIADGQPNASLTGDGTLVAG